MVEIKIISGIHLISKTMKEKEMLKKIFFGKLIPLKEEIEEDIYEYQSPDHNLLILLTLNVKLFMLKPTYKTQGQLEGVAF